MMERRFARSRGGQYLSGPSVLPRSLTGKPLRQGPIEFLT